MHVCVVAGGGKGEVLLNDELLEYRFDCDVDGDAWFRLLCRIFIIWFHFSHTNGTLLQTTIQPFSRFLLNY